MNLVVELHAYISEYLRSEDRLNALESGLALRTRNPEDEMLAKETAIAKLNELERRGFPEDLALRALLILNTRVEGVPLDINLESEGTQNLQSLRHEDHEWRNMVALYHGNEAQFPFWRMRIEDISLPELTNEEEPPPSSDTNRDAIEDIRNGAIAQPKAAEATKAPPVNSNDGLRAEGAQLKENSEGMLSPRQIADKYSLPHESVRKALARWRAMYGGGDGFISNEDARGTEPRFFYDLRFVGHVIDGIKRRNHIRTKTSGKRPGPK
jgi:hypothetical protein